MLLLSSIYRSQIITRDNLVEMFLKRMGIINKKGKEDCTAISSYKGNNWLPLLEKFYKNHRKTVFRLITLLKIDSTTQHVRKHSKLWERTWKCSILVKECIQRMGTYHRLKKNIRTNGRLHTCNGLCLLYYFTTNEDRV